MKTETVLIESVATKRLGKPIYFASWIVGFGPRTTDKPEEAFRFESYQDALGSQAMSHALSYFETLPAAEMLPA